MNDVHSTSRFAAERYLLGEMSADERESFEEHFFSCPECADQVLAGAAFVDNARAVLPEMDRAAAKPEKAPARWWRWQFAPQLAMAAAVVLAGITFYQSAVVIPRLRTGSASNDLTISGAPVLTARRAANDLSFSAKSGVATVVIPNEWEENFPSYATEVRKDSWAEPVLSTAAVPATGNIVVRIPTDRLGVGKYTMILYGVSATGTKQVIGRYPFSIQD
jgi:anti-sigma factor RsiW